VDGGGAVRDAGGAAGKGEDHDERRRRSHRRSTYPTPTHL
jgi:hypothetical protein